MTSPKDISNFLTSICITVFFATIASATPLKLHQISPAFPSGCGVFSVVANLNYKNKKITIWTGSLQESSLTFDTTTCPRCRFLDGMVVKTTVHLDAQNKSVKIQEIKAVLSDQQTEAVKIRDIPCS